MSRKHNCGYILYFRNIIFILTPSYPARDKCIPVVHFCFLKHIFNVFYCIKIHCKFSYICLCPPHPKKSEVQLHHHHLQEHFPLPDAHFSSICYSLVWFGKLLMLQKTAWAQLCLSPGGWHWQEYDNHELGDHCYQHLHAWHALHSKIRYFTEMSSSNILHTVIV